jgi:hypothetical protein
LREFILQAVCDSNMHLLDVFCGWPGSVHDARVMTNFPLYAKIDTDMESVFPGNTHLLGDSAYGFLIGDVGYAFCNEFGIFYDVHGEMFLICLGNCLLLLVHLLKIQVSSWFAKQISWTVQQLTTTLTIFAISTMSTFVYTLVF